MYDRDELICHPFEGEAFSDAGLAAEALLVEEGEIVHCGFERGRERCGIFRVWIWVEEAMGMCGVVRGVVHCLEHFRECGGLGLDHGDTAGHGFDEIQAKRLAVVCGHAERVEF